MSNKKTPYHQLFRILHWALAITMPVLIFTGVAIHSVARPGWSICNNYISWFPGGRMVFIHLIFGLFFAPATLIASVIFIKRFQNLSSKKLNLRWTANFLLVIGSLVALFSALGLLYPVPNWLYQLSRFFHSISSLVIIPIGFVIHTALAFSKHKKVIPMVFAPLRSPKWLTLIWIPVIVAVTSVVLLQLPTKATTRQWLISEKIDSIEKNMEAVKTIKWETQKPLNVMLYNGVGFNKGSTKLELRSAYDNNYLYVRAVWEDPTYDTQYWPVKRTANGWKYMQNSLHDEQVDYEDKFSLAFPIKENKTFNKFGCAITCHQGADEKRFPYGYKAVADKMDVWHWKSARSGSVGFIDDKYWHKADLSRKDVGRYGDGGEKGPYIKNISKDKSHPLYLPKTPEATIYNGSAIRKEDAVEYSEELAKNIPVGTLIPGVVVAPFTGDRGHVHCRSEYKDGKYTLWIRRKLNTGSEDDVVFTPGESVAFGAATFDHAAKRHAYHMTTYRLFLRK